MKKINTEIFTQISDIREMKNVINTSKLNDNPRLIALWPSTLYFFRNFEISKGWHREIKDEVCSNIDGNSSYNRNWLKSDFFVDRTKKKEQFISFIDLQIKNYVSALYEVNPNVKLLYNITGWVNIRGKGDYHWDHFHEHSQYSFVYYLECTDEDPVPHLYSEENNGNVFGGVLTFLDPRGSGPYMIGPEGHHNFGRIFVRPTEGVFVLFPSFLLHSVAPTLLDKKRISIAGNILNLGYQK